MPWVLRGHRRLALPRCRHCGAGLSIDLNSTGEKARWYSVHAEKIFYRCPSFFMWRRHKP